MKFILTSMLFPKADEPPGVYIPVDLWKLAESAVDDVLS